MPPGKEGLNDRVFFLPSVGKWLGLEGRREDQTPQASEGGSPVGVRGVVPGAERRGVLAELPCGGEGCLPQHLQGEGGGLKGDGRPQWVCVPGDTDTRLAGPRAGGQAPAGSPGWERCHPPAALSRGPSTASTLDSDPTSREAAVLLKTVLGMRWLDGWSCEEPHSQLPEAGSPRTQEAQVLIWSCPSPSVTPCTLELSCMQLSEPTGPQLIQHGLVIMKVLTVI